ncbi:hypothetical protein CCO04_05050 [Pimelobacter sp. 30-1]|nr:hypothetical protein [Pimelobacter sp. 30-1]
MGQDALVLLGDRSAQEPPLRPRGDCRSRSICSRTVAGSGQHPSIQQEVSAGRAAHAAGRRETRCQADSQESVSPGQRPRSHSHLRSAAATSAGSGYGACARPRES